MLLESLGRRRTLASHVRLAVVCAVILLGSRATAQEPEKPKKETRPEVLTTQDDWPIHITYYQSDLGKETPVVMLLHMYGGNRRVWEGSDGFAEKLSTAGYAVVNVDLRKHGQSKKASDTDSATSGRSKGGDATGVKPADYEAMVQYDLEAVKEFIYQEHQKQHLNMNKLAIVAPEKSAPIALYYAVADWNKKPHDDAPTEATRTPRGKDVRAFILLSPASNLPRLPTGNILKTLRNPEWNIAFLILYGKSDAEDRGDARRMYQQLIGSEGIEDRAFLKDFNNNFRGTDALNKEGRGLEDYMVAFLDKFLKGAPGQWQDRRSRFERGSGSQ
jgi:pimeloyl-ACP methyl ester carboxylesterase